MERIETSPYCEDRPTYGHVFIVAGRWKGRRGYYDNDDGTYCIVYLQNVDGWVRVRPSSLVEAPGPDDLLH